MPLQATSGAASYDAFGGGVPVEPVYIEQIFSTYLYTGNDSSQTITNGVNLSANGGLVWIKARTATYSHILSDTVRGTGKFLSSNTTDAQGTDAQDVTAFNTTGFTVGNNSRVNNSSFTYASWTFRKQPKFFDVVTYTGNGTAGRTVAHSLGSVPGCVIVKQTSSSGNNWKVYHRSLGGTKFLNLSATTAAGTDIAYWNNTDPTSTVFTVGDDSSVNANGSSYVAYIFAHDAGGFGLTGTDNVISCGSFTPDALGNATVNLGYEPQWILYKGVSGAGGTDSWVILDTMRGWDLTASDRRLFPNTSGAENTSSAGFPTATGFQVENLSNSPYIYIAIRRGPMKVPTTGTSVFAPVKKDFDGLVNSGFPTDLIFGTQLEGGNDWRWLDRLRGGNKTLSSNATSAEATENYWKFDNNSGVVLNIGSTFSTWSWCNFLRAPSFFDVVCYTGTGSSQNVAHNLAVVPELLIIKRRNSTGGWEAAVPSTTAGSFFVGTSGAPISLNTTNGNGGQTAYAWASNTGTSTYFNPEGIFWNGNVSSGTYVAYLFATCAGVSKVGSYTGTGTTKQIDCGFTGGARFVLIKRTDSTGDWYVWDSARGIIAGNDPYLLLNSTAAEVTNTDYVDTAATGFEISSTAPAAINASGGTFIFLAVA